MVNLKKGNDIFTKMKNEANEFNDGFWGFGIGMNSVNVTTNKVLKNNQCIARDIYE
ncbi:hypothetical protein [Campylobacter cuniculorum]|uniref:Uncharacterized protein n=1 Tax=Campylobacter cuniculorum TaxID=374106 RepID=A0ABX6TWJ5_9BACT|nr:hypothetical protein [Campylobacter cuniculorum]QOR04087.1 hypothetical protein A0071_07970 [Campylobacter cuniculorum]